MAEPPTMEEVVDSKNLEVLSILHYVLGSLTIAIALGLVVIVAYALGMPMHSIINNLELKGMGQSSISLLAYGAPALLFTIGFSPFLATGVATIYSGLCMKRRKRRIFSLTVAWLYCVLDGPVGIALGVYTIIVLTRASVKRIYESNRALQPT